MSLWDTIKGWFGGGPDMGRRLQNRLYVIDASRLLEGRGDRPGPREQAQFLQQLSKFAGQEQLKVQCVLEGRPLREVEHGGVFNGVTVWYAEKTTDIGDLVLKAARSASGGHGVVVITADTQLEARARESGALIMKASTLRKAMEGGASGGYQGGGDGGGRGGMRPPRRRFRNGPPREERSERPYTPAAQDGGGHPAESAPETAGPAENSGSRPEEKKGQGNVRDLIDLVED